MFWLKMLVVNVSSHSKLIRSFQGHLSASPPRFWCDSYPFVIVMLATVNWTPFSFRRDCYRFSDFELYIANYQVKLDLRHAPQLNAEWRQFIRGRVKQCKLTFNCLRNENPGVSVGVWNNGDFLFLAWSVLFRVSTNLHCIRDRFSFSWVDRLFRSVKAQLVRSVPRKCTILYMYVDAIFWSQGIHFTNWRSWS